MNRLASQTYLKLQRPEFGASTLPEQLQQAERVPRVGWGAISTRGLLCQILPLGMRGKGIGPGVALLYTWFVFLLVIS